MSYHILAINPGATSTKVAMFRDERLFFVQTIRHTAEELIGFDRVVDQFDFRYNKIIEVLQMHDIYLSRIHAVIGRGGLIKPLTSGVYKVNDLMLEHLAQGLSGEHASNLGGMLAHRLAQIIPGCQAFIADPVVVDEFDDVARISGLPEFPRKSIFHALNQKAIARRHALYACKDYEKLNLIVVHLGGGITIGVHKQGRVVDANNTLYGEGPFTPDRCGAIPPQMIVDMCFSGKYTYAQACKHINGKAGLQAHLGTNSFKEICDRVEEGDPHARSIYEAMAYNISKTIGASAAVLAGEIDGILFTGGMAYDRPFVELIADRVKFLAPIFRYPGEDELTALSENALAVLKGVREAKEYV